MKRHVLIGLIWLVISAFGFFTTEAQTGGERTLKVKIYLLDMFEQDAVLDASDLVSVNRQVNAAMPLRSTLEALLKGATKEEEETYRFYSPADGFKLISVRQVKHTAYLNFTKNDPQPLNRRSAFIFKTAVNKTTLQFPGIWRVEICLDGVANFDRFGSNIKYKKC